LSVAEALKAKRNTVRVIPDTTDKLNTFPFISVSSYNTTSLGAYSGSGTGGGRRRTEQVLVRDSLPLQHDITAYQETKLNGDDTSTLSTKFPNALLLYNNNPDNRSSGTTNKAGTLLVVSKDIDDRYKHTTHPLPRVAQGYAQAVSFAPRGGKEAKPFLFINLYLIGDNEAKLLAILGALLGVPTQQHVYLTGDLNFIEHDDDTTSTRTGSSRLTGKAQAIWNKVVERFKLREITQSVHTYAHDHTDQDGVRVTRSTRIDRMYTSLGDAAAAIYEDLLTVTNPEWLLQKSFSGHAPLSLKWTPSPREPGPQMRKKSPYGQ
jgi:exonuclease III